MEATIPTLPESAGDARAVRLRVVLSNPGTAPDHPFSAASEESLLDLR
jgi:hypothetical protein